MADAVGRAALTIGGAVFFGPVGGVVGGILGDILFPAEAGKGPRLNELNVQHSTVGAPIPIVYGTARLAGNVIWSGGLIESQHEGESAGKGGPSGPTTYTYSVDIAIGISEGPISGIRRLWADADLIYDSSSDEVLTERLGNSANVAELIAGIRAMSAQLDFELYLGTEDQLPDPTIESYEDAGTVPAFRGLAYIVLPAFALERFGNRIPNFTFEIYSGTPTECGIYSAGNLEPWQFQLDAGTYDPRNPENNHVYRWTQGLGSIPQHTLAIAKAQIEAGYSRTFLISDALGQGYGDNLYINGWAYSTTSNDIRPCDDELGIADAVIVNISVNSLGELERHCREEFVDIGNPCEDVAGVLGIQNVGHVSDGQESGFWVVREDVNPAEGFFGGYAASSETNCSGIYTLSKLFDGELAVSRTLLPPDPCSLGSPLAGAPGYCVVGGQVIQGITWTEVAGTFRCLQEYADNGSVVTAYPVDPCLRSDDPDYNNQAYWEAAYAQALADGEPIASGLVYGVDYPDTQSYAYFSECDTVDTACVPMAIIVADICRRAGLRTDTSTQIDVSGLTTCVTGYIIGRQMSARDALGPLRMFGLWDAVESGALLRFVERGAVIVETLTADDLGAHENGSQAPTAVEVSRVQEKDLPRRVRLHFANFLHDHEPSEQSASRLATEAIDEIDVELPISMEPDTAAQLADIMLYARWVGRNTYRFALDNNRLALEPTDCIEIPVDGQTERVRIVAVNYKIGGILEIDAQRDDDGSYISTATGDPSTPSGGIPGSHGNGPICPSEVVLLDISRLRDQDTDAGYYAAIYGLCPETWSCAELYRSNDGGATFGRVARTDRQATVGEIDDITGPPTDVALLGDSPQYDESNSITVTLFNGTLSSITDAQIQAGLNAAAIGVDGRWVIIQYKTATLSTENTWVLTDLIWGINDTRHLLGTTVAGDTFVWLNDPALLRIPETPANIGVSKEFKVPTCGESLDAVDEFSFTTWGLSYLRLCPSSVISASLTEPPLSPVDGDSYLIPNDTSLSGLWQEHGGEIATWSDETDNWVYCTPAPGTIIHVGGDSSDPGDDVISGGDGTTTPAPWTPAIPPLAEATPADDDYFVFYDGTTYKKGLMSEIAGGGGGLDTSGDVTLALDQLSDVTIGSPLTEGDILVYRGTEGWVNEPVETAIGGGGGFAYVNGAEIVGSASNTLTVSGLDLDTDELYYVVVRGKNASGTLTNIRLFYNSDTTVTNYYTELQGGGGATAANTATITGFFAAAASELTARGTISRPVNRVTSEWTTGIVAGTVASTRAHQAAHQWSTLSTNVTSITLSVESGAGFDVGSRADVWKMSTTGGGGGGGFTSPVTTKGDLFTFDTDDARLAVGTTGDVLVADSTTATGLKWGVPGIPSNAQAGNYTIVANDNGRSIDHASGAGAGDTYTIPANGTLALPLGFTFSVSNMDSNALTVAITTDTLRKAGTGSTGSVSVAQYGTATFRKVATTEWLWTGVGAT